MKMRIVAIMLTLAAGSATADEGSTPPREAYDVCDEQLHDALGRPVPDKRKTITTEANHPVGETARPSPPHGDEEVADAKG